MKPLPPISWAHTPLRALPIPQNFYGSANLRPDGFSLGPIPLGSLVGNFYNSSLELDGHAFDLQHLSWEGCEGIRGGVAGDVNLTVATRLALDERVIVQKVEISAGGTAELLFDGPFFRACDDEDVAESGSCGWGLTLPTDKENFTLSLTADGVVPVMVTSDTLTSAVAASALISSCDDEPNITLSSPISFTAVASCSRPFTLMHLIAVAPNETAALALLSTHLESPASSFDAACTDWHTRFTSAFSPSSSLFSGHLPTLDTPSIALKRLYTWSATGGLLPRLP